MHDGKIVYKAVADTFGYKYFENNFKKLVVDTLKKIVGEDSVLSDGKEKSRFDHIWKTEIPQML